MPKSWASATCLGVVAILILMGVVGLPTGSARKIPIASSEAMIDAAVASLNEGNGPAHGVPAECAVTDGAEAACGPPSGSGSSYHAAPGRTAPATTGPVRTLAPVPPRWFNVTANVSTHSDGHLPSVYTSGRMAYDPLLSEVVLFDGCAFGTCPDNETWTYNGISWTDITGRLALSPSPRNGSGMDYDPSFRGIVLFGGTNNVTGTLDDTWLFNGTEWNNITSKVGVPENIGSGVGWSEGAMAFDPALDSMVVVDGCEISTCATIWDYTWFLTADKWTVSSAPGAPTSPTRLAYTSAVYDPADSDLVLFGGYDPNTQGSTNYTFLLDSSGNWVNITLDDAGCAASVCYTPQGRDSEAMTWDSQLDAVFMTDGFNVTAVRWLNDSWVFSAGTWLPANLTAPNAPSGYCPAAQPAMPEESTNVTPVIIGGGGPCTSPNPTSASTVEWVYEIPPQPTLAPSAVHFDPGELTVFNATWTVGTGSGVTATWNVSLGDGHYNSTARAVTGENTSVPYSHLFNHTYATAGTFQANVTWTDFFYIAGTAAAPLITVNPALSATIDASATSIKVGASITFSSAPTGGTAPYEYAWSFGDGTTSTVQAPPAHAYSKVGSYTVDLTVTDSAKRAVNASLTIMVTGMTSPLTRLTTTDLVLIIAVVFVVVAALVALLAMRRRKAPPQIVMSPRSTTRPTGGQPPQRPPPPPQ